MNEQEQAETVLGSQHVEGIRLFHLDFGGMLLCSLNRPKENVWLPGEIQTARCKIAHAHNIQQPALDCTCGIWSCKSRHGLVQSFPMLVMQFSNGADHDLFYPTPSPLEVWYISARVEQWGVTIEHEWGYRSEFARIIPETIQVFPRAFARRNRKHVQHLREKYHK